MVEVNPSITEICTEAISSFIQYFGSIPDVKAYAPGRVTLIGDHTDYNQGLSLPMAIPLYTVVVGRKSETTECTVVALNPEFQSHKVHTFSPYLDTLERKKLGPQWAYYVMGVVSQFKVVTCPFEAVILSSIPVSSGLSSSAGLEIAMFTFLEAINSITEESQVKKAIACHRAEHVYAGIPCGIMDQFTSVFGKQKNFLYLDSNDLSYQLAEFTDENIKLLITDSLFRFILYPSKFSERRSECEQAMTILGYRLNQCTFDKLKDSKKMLNDVLYRRAMHVVKENQRVAEAFECLRSLNYARLGELMRESHVSLKNDFEVSCPEIDKLVDTANDFPGVYGSRMTGGGFGGCTVTVVDKEAIDGLIVALTEAAGRKIKFYILEPVDGCGVLSYPAAF